jgi:hypothetical protein
MAVTTSNTISASDYNSLRTTLNSILVTTYGQTARTTPVTGFATQGLSANQVTASQMLNLFLDVQSVRVHQTGAVSTLIAVPATGQTVGANTVQAYNQTTGAKSNITSGTLMGYNDYESVITSAADFDGSTSGWPDASFSLGTELSSARQQNWGNTSTTASIYHVVTVTFASEPAKTHYFNAGGEIRFSGTLTNGSGDKYTNWTGLLGAMGTVKFDKYSTTASSGIPNPLGSGLDSLTSSYRLLFTKDGSGVYASNQYTVEGYNVTPTQLRFRIRFNDASVGGTDEAVSGTTTSIVNTFRPDSSFVYNSTTYTGVSIAAPSLATAVTMTANNATPPV